MALGVLTNTGISLGNLDIALDYLSNPSEFEAELAEVKTTIYNKEERQYTTPKKDIVKPKLTEQALLNMFSIIHNKQEVESDESLDTDITMKDSSDFDVDFDDMDFDFDFDEETTVKEEIKAVETKLESVEIKSDTEVNSDITKHIDLNILKLVEHSDEIIDEDDSEEDDLFIDDEDEQDLFTDDSEEDDLFIDDEDEEQDLFSDDIDSLFEDDEDDEQEQVKQPVVKQVEQTKTMVEQVKKVESKVKVEESREDEDLFIGEEDDDLLMDDEDDLFADDEDLDELFNLEEDNEQVIKKVEQPKVVEQPKAKVEDIKKKEVVESQQKVKSAAEVELELLRKQLAEKDKQISKLINNDKQAIQTTQDTVKAVSQIAKAAIKTDDNTNKLVNKAVVKRKATEVKEVEGSPYDKYTVMNIDALYKVVKEFMIVKGVRKGPLDIQMLNDKFGVDNIKKLTTKHYLIKTKKGVTVGI